MPALEMSGVRKTYRLGDEEIVALDDVDLDAEDEMVVLMGPSGSGKTTLLSVAGALLSPTGGRVRVAGEDISGLDDRGLARFRREQIGFVFQNVNLVPFLTARENLTVVREIGGGRRDRRRARERADQLLEELQLTDRVNHLPGQLSGGQRQRVAIGRALMNDPALVLVDEPTSALDSELGRQVMDMLREEVTGRGVTAIVVTHDALVTEYGDRTIHMADGQLEQQVGGRAPEAVPHDNVG